MTVNCPLCGRPMEPGYLYGSAPLLWSPKEKKRTLIKGREDVSLLKSGAYRDKLARATCAGICDYLGLEVKEPDQESGQPNEPDGWAKEAWSKASAAGVFDGTRPRDALTRQEAAVVLNRLGLLEKGD